MIKRLHLFEFEDQTWFPGFLRQHITEFLAHVARMTQLWKPTAEVLNNLLATSAEKRIVVLGAGSGGGILDVLPLIPSHIPVVLTDLFPNADFTHVDPRLQYLKQPINATSIPEDLKGVRVMYASFHHLQPELAKAVVKNAVETQQPIAIFEGTERSVKGFVATLFIPLMVLIITPFIRPFSISRLVFTYIIPILPLIIFWDGLVSSLRTYSVKEMQKITSDFPDFSWTIKILKGPRGENIPSLIGHPLKGKS